MNLSNNATLSDQPQRIRALDPEHSFIVQAPAGSGKTGLLVRRYLSLLSRVTEPEQILAITFTRKATAEMSDRILSALESAGSGNIQNDDDQEIFQLAKAVLERDTELGWNLRQNPRRLRIQTIDSLCYELVRSMPWSSRFGAAPDILDNDQAVEYYREAARNTLNHIEEKDQNAAYVATILKLVNVQLSRARQLLAEMLAKRDLWLRGIHIDSRENFETMWQRVITEELEEISGLIPDQEKQDISEMMRFAAENLHTAGIDHGILQCQGFPPPEVESLSCWHGIADFLLTKQNNRYQLRKTVNKNNGFPSEDKEQKQRMVDLLKHLAEQPDTVAALGKIPVLPEPVFSDEKWQALEALLHILPMAAAELRLLFSENNSADYSEITQRAETALHSGDSPTDLALLLDYRISHLLMDEVQDTSKAHLDIVSAITREWMPGDGRTLFFVGDPMQSIYRFREADITNFLSIQQHGLGEIKPESLVLQTNFRSSRYLINWFNDTFSQVFPAKNDLINAAVKYSPGSSPSDADSDPTPGVRFYGFEDDQENTQTTPLSQHITDALKNHQNAGIGILGRSRKHLAAVAQTLRQHNIPFQAEELEPLDTRPTIQDLIALTRALLHPGDRIAWMSLLRGPWCGLSLTDITLLAGEDHTATILSLCNDALTRQKLSTDSSRRLNNLIQRLSQPLAMHGRIPLRDNVQSAWISLGGPGCVESRELADCEAYLELLDKLEARNKPITPESLLLAVNRLWSQTSVNARVQLLTIHKSKGLEFDIVFLPFLDRWSGQQNTELLRWARTGDNLLVATLSPSDDKDDRLNHYLRNLEKQRQTHEDCRLLYVACTRARKQLHLYASLKTNDQGEARLPDSRSLLSLLWPAVESDFLDHLYPPTTDPGNDPTPCDSPDMRRLPVDWKPMRIPDALTDVITPGPALSPTDEPIEFSWASETLRISGIAIHYLLQQINNNWSAWKQQDDDKKLEMVHPVLLQNGLSGQQLQLAKSNVKQALVNLKSDSRADWIFSETHCHV